MLGFYPTASAPTGTAGLSQAAPPPDPGPGPITPGRPGINEATIMRLTTINVSTALGPAAINLTANLP